MLNRRDMLGRTAGTLGLAALSSLLRAETHHKPAAKSAICVFLIGGTSQVDLFDPKPALANHHGKPIPESFRTGVRLGQTSYSAPVMQSPFKFRRYGSCGMGLSDLLPEIGSCADDITLIRSVHHEAFD